MVAIWGKSKDGVSGLWGKRQRPWSATRLQPERETILRGTTPRASWRLSYVLSCIVDICVGCLVRNQKRIYPAPRFGPWTTKHEEKIWRKYSVGWTMESWILSGLLEALSSTRASVDRTSLGLRSTIPHLGQDPQRTALNCSQTRQGLARPNGDLLRTAAEGDFWANEDTVKGQECGKRGTFTCHMGRAGTLK